MNKEFEERGYKLIELNLGYEDLMVKTFEECAGAHKFQPGLTQIDVVSCKSIDISMEPLTSIVHREYLTSIVEKETDLKLIPTYCYMRKYFQGSVLYSHTDRDANEISLSYCISGPEWEINMGDNALITKIGNGVIYKGCEILHGRSKPSSGEVIQVFNQWIISDGEKSNSAYDHGKYKEFYSGWKKGNMSRQERRHQERLKKKQGGKKEYEIPVQLMQPWSVPVMKTTLPPDVLQTMIEISDLVIADKEAESAGKTLVGQIETELEIDPNILKQTGVMSFFMGIIRQFIITCKCQTQPSRITEIQQEEWLTNIITMWVVSQQPGEYNPMHIHTGCTISAVMYLKIPKMLPSRKEHRQCDDGSIVFSNNASRDIALSIPNFTISPEVGDFFIFGAQQQHGVYPYRCEEGDPERRSISFNAVFQSKTEHDNETKK